MDPKLPTDDDTNVLFDSVVSVLQNHFAYSGEEATSLAREYYEKFTDPIYCAQIGIPAQGDDFFHHEAAGGLALRIHYYLRLRANPDAHAFLEWRAERQRTS